MLNNFFTAYETINYMQKEIIYMQKFTYDFLKKNGVAISLFSLSNIIADLKDKNVMNAS